MDINDASSFAELINSEVFHLLISKVAIDSSSFSSVMFVINSPGADVAWPSGCFTNQKATHLCYYWSDFQLSSHTGFPPLWKGLLPTKAEYSPSWKLSSICLLFCCSEILEGYRWMIWAICVDGNSLENFFLIIKVNRKRPKSRTKPRLIDRLDSYL